jgi:hypothetical protein
MPDGTASHFLLDAPRSSLRETEELQRGRKLQRLTNRYKREFREERIPICHDDDARHRYESEFYDEREKPERLDASPDAFCTVERIVGLAVRDGLALPFFLSRNAGPASGVYSGRVQTLQCVYPKCR